MVRLGKLTDYAVILLAQMVRMEGIATTSFLVEKTRLPQPTVAKILKMLAKGGVLKAQRGAVGGYTLTRAAADISIADIVTAMDGPIALTACVEGSHSTCQREKQCSMNGHWNRINTAIRAALGAVSLQEIAADPPSFMAFADASKEAPVEMHRE
jgi:FeS assembly SUF system regulator